MCGVAKCFKLRNQFFSIGAWYVPFLSICMWYIIHLYSHNCAIFKNLFVGDVAGLPTRLSLDYSAFEKYIHMYTIILYAVILSDIKFAK